jgi:DNA-binding LacI/PurR family transcriptional regulator
VSKDDKARAANIFDVARLAGVSHQTVSRVVNGHPSVRPNTRLRVEEAIKQLRYRPSTAARALVTRRSRNLGLIMPGSPDFGPSSTVLAFTRAARGARYTVSVTSVFEPDGESVRAAVESLLGQHVEAIVVVADDRRVLDETARIELEVPLVAVDSIRRVGSYAVSVDQYAGARMATEYLVGLGHTTIVHLAGPVTSVDGAERERGWRDVLAEHGLVSSPPLFGDWTPDSGYRLVSAAIGRGFTAIFSANDQMALGAMHALTDAGVDVPGQVSIVGFDDIPQAAHFRPPLTTVHQDFDQLGGDIMAAVLEVLDENTPTIPPRRPTLVERQSTSRIRSAPADPPPTLPRSSGVAARP